LHEKINDVEQLDQQIRASNAAINWFKEDIKNKQQQCKKLNDELKEKNLQIIEIKKKYNKNNEIVSNKNNMLIQTQDRMKKIAGDLEKDVVDKLGIDKDPVSFKIDEDTSILDVISGESEDEKTKSIDDLQDTVKSSVHSVKDKKDK